MLGLSKLDEPSPNQRPIFEIYRPRCLLLGQPDGLQLPIRRSEQSQVCDLKRQCHRFMNQLHRFTLIRFEGSAKSFVAAYDFNQTVLKSPNMELACQPNGPRDT